MRILHVSAELYPLLKTGGLADVIAALSLAQHAAGKDVRLLLPGLPAFMRHIATIEINQLDTFAGRVTLRYGEYQKRGIYLIDAPHLYNREGNPYHDDHCHTYADNHLRFGLLGWIAKELAWGADPYWHPDIIHAHDWHAGLVCPYIKQSHNAVKTIFTIHNIAYQGAFSLHHFHELQLQDFYAVEFYGQLNFLKAGIACADHVTTVSPTYAQEILSAEFAFGMEGILQQRHDEQQLSGILNGADYQIWHPNKDTFIHTRYRTNQLHKKRQNKQTLQQQFSLSTTPDAFLCGVVSRLSYQKGLDLLLEALPTLLALGGQLILVGEGESELQHRYQQLRDNYPDQIAVYFGYDEALAHQTIASCDALIIPSRFEPCGLTQLYALKYGTLPIARKTGGLADTIVDDNTENANGFLFQHADSTAIHWAINQAYQCWQDADCWKKRQQHAMSVDFSWRTSAKAYLALYQHTLASR